MNEPQVVNDVVLQCINSVCGAKFKVRPPQPTVMNDTPFCVAIWGQPPIRCPQCGAVYIFQIKAVAVDFDYGRLEATDSGPRIVVPGPGKSV